jgi:hypothetical protein
MTTTTLAVVEPEEALGLPSGPMSDSEKRDRDNSSHATNWQARIDWKRL